jgi:subtilisin family serine protease
MKLECVGSTQHSAIKPREAFRFSLLILVVWFGWNLSGTTSAASRPKYVPNELIVVFRPEADELKQDSLANEHGDETLQRLEGIHGRLVKIRGNRSLGQAIREYQTSANVLFAEPNYILHAVTTPNDTFYSTYQWNFNNTGQNGGTSGADIKAESAWTLTTGTASVVVGVVDTGIAYNHPDLAANVWVNPGDINGGTAGSHGYNAITKNYKPLDDNGHGTHVSGIIGAVGNNLAGVAGINWSASIMGLKFLDKDGYGTTADAIDAIDWAIKAKQAGVNLRVLNNSWGGGDASQSLLDEINKAYTNDILFVVAAGNDTNDIDIIPSYPASFNTLNMVTVAATDRNDLLAYFSCYGQSSVHLGAPGLDIASTYLSGGYALMSGTSMAAPHVSGAAALMLAGGYQSATTLKTRLLNSVDGIPSLIGKTVTGGRLNLYRAVLAGDVSSPTATASARPSPNASGWNNADVTVTITATDNPGGFGVASITYSAAGATTVASTQVSGNSALLPVVTAEGVTTISYFATDLSGNSSVAQTSTVRIGKSVPNLSWGTPTPAANSFGWNNTAVSLAWTATDTVSGVSTPGTSGAVTFTSPGASQTQSITVVDNAGNSAGPFTSPLINLDFTPPTIMAGVTKGVGRTVVPIRISAIIGDGLSGFDPSAGAGTYTVNDESGTTVLNGSFTFSGRGSWSLNTGVPKSSTQTYSVTVTGKDKAGNLASASTTFSIP